MVRRITFIIGLGMSLLSAQQASAVPVAPVDLATITLGASVGTSTDDFDNDPAFAPPPTTGTLDSEVFFDGTNYVYVQAVTPSEDNNFLFNTEFAVRGFTGVAGWDFANAGAAGGGGDASDFQLVELAGRLVWITTLDGLSFEWDATEPIKFFFVSTLPPAVRNYNLVSTLPTEFGTAEGLAPVPEPGSIALFGSGLVGLIAAMRRRRNLKL
jgi:hypothetical protein